MDKSLKMIIESLLFAADKPLSEKDLHVWLHDAPLGKIREALTALQSEYEDMDRSFALKAVAGGYQFRTRSAYAPYVIHMLKTSPGRLSKAAMETLAIIAYKQPILRSEIERLRGVDVGGIVRTLLEKNLIRIMGRKNLPGKPLIYGTTKKFLEVFDLEDLDSLPKLKEIKDLGADEGQIEDTSEQVFPQEADRAETDSVAGPPDKGGEETSPEPAEDPGPGHGQGGDAAEAESDRRAEERAEADRAETDD
ncbi:MAG: SMC-Scp complex subunit ScpB, partial [Deltaproteobacteria bacterium]|nr:SMC-Scp complex subunit ScpB [Deltaproteobacteria bacterium]